MISIKDYVSSNRSRMPLVLCIGLVFWLVSSTFTGPSYLQDEIGYLSNASFLAGFRVDGASSYHCGYSIFLAPLFRIFDDPFVIWQGIMALNALIWCGTFLLLFRIADAFFPHSTEIEKKTAIIMTSLYPACISMCGYAFPSTLLFLVILLSFYCLFLSDSNKWWTILPHSFLTGVLYWIHPTGLAAIVASIMVVGWSSIRDKRFKVFFANCLVIFLLCGVHKKLIHPFVIAGMTPDGFLPHIHYPKIKEMIGSLVSVRYVGKVLLMFCGQFSYLIVSSAGIFVCGLWSAFASTSKVPDSSTHKIYKTSYKKSEAYRFAFLSLLGTILMGSLMFIYVSGYLDCWIYGRYIEPFALIFIFTGFIAEVPLRSLIYLSAFIIPVGMTIDSLQFSGKIGNLLNVPAFWPVFVGQYTTFTMFMLLGFAGVCILSVSRKLVRNTLLIILFIISTRGQYLFHQSVLKNYSAPTGLVGFVRSRLSKGALVGIEPRAASITKKNEHLKMYSFYFFDYDYRRMNVDDWKRFEGDKLYLSYDYQPFYLDNSLRVLARELDIGLYLCATDKFTYPNEKEKVQWHSGISFGSQGIQKELISGCFAKTPQEISGYSQVGRFVNGKLETDGRSGFLFYGPYFPLQPEKYMVSVDALILSPHGVTLDVTSSGGAIKHGELVLGDELHKENITENKCIFRLPFTLDKAVSDIEIRLQVTADSDIKISGYEVGLDR